MHLSDSDSSSYETSYSLDEWIEQELAREKELQKNKEYVENVERKHKFEDVFEEKSLPFFNFKGLEVITLNHLKIKLMFVPKQVVTFVNSEVRFFISLKYVQRLKFWRLKRDSFPVTCKSNLRTLFYRKEDADFEVNDGNIFMTVTLIYNIFFKWSIKEDRFRRGKLKEYRRGDDVELDSDDLMFLSLDERNQVMFKRVCILKRMIPPKRQQYQLRSRDLYD